MRVGLALKGYHVTKETSLQEMVNSHTLAGYKVGCNDAVITSSKLI